MSRTARCHVRVALIWHSLKSGNLGVGALTLGQIAIVKAAAARNEIDVSFDILGWGSELNYIENVPEALGQTHVSARKLALPGSKLNRRIAAADIILDIAAGDSFSDIYGMRRFLLMAALKVRAIVSGKPYILSPQTIGPYKSRLAKIIAAAIMRRATRTYARDRDSFELLLSMRIPRAVESIDVAFRLPYEAGSRPIDGTVRIGLNVSALLFNNGYTGENEFGTRARYRDVIHRLVESLLARSGVEIHLVPHVVRANFPMEDDYLVAQELKVCYPNLHLAPCFESPGDAKSYISTLDLLIGSRMHATIAAFSSGVPVVPLAYSPKFSGLFSSLGCEGTVDLRTTDEADILRAVDEALSQLPVLREATIHGRAIAETKLKSYEDDIARLLAQFRP